LSVDDTASHVLQLYMQLQTCNIRTLTFTVVIGSNAKYVL